jgi:hypothetical protein
MTSGSCGGCLDGSHQIQWEDAMRNRSARWLAVRRVHLLHLLCPVWACTPVLILLLHDVGDLWPLAPSPVTALYSAGGNLRPTLRDVCGRAAVGAPVSALPRDALF